MGLLIPSVTGVIENAKRAQAKNDVTQIATAIISYETEYGRLPETTGTVDADLLETLGAQNDDTNPRGIVFLEIPTAKGGKNGAEGTGATFSSGYKDSWGEVYQIAVDDDYNNQVTADGVTVRKKVAVWSEGNPSKTPKKLVKSWE